VVLQFKIHNTGNIVDNYSYSITDNNGYMGGPASGTTAAIAAGGTATIPVKLNVPADCQPPQDVVTFSYVPAGEGCLQPQTCMVTVQCDVGTPTLISNVVATQGNGGVDVTWFSDAVDQIKSWNVYRAGSANGGYVLLNGTPIAMLSGGSFRFHDDSPFDGAAWYRVAGVYADGSERILATTAAGAAEAFSFSLSGTNPVVSGARLRYSLPAPTHVRIDVFNVTGQRVRTLVDRGETAGVHSADLAGAALTPGVYMVRIRAGKDEKTLRVVTLD